MIRPCLEKSISSGPWFTGGVPLDNTKYLWLFNIAMENDPFIDDFPVNTSIYKGFSMAMLNIQMVIKNWDIPW
jgi:hypothetical protein